MLSKIYSWLLNRRNLAPDIELSDQCAVPDCTREASEQWFPSFCALREADVKIEWVSVCAEHDVAINENSVRALFGNKYDDELKAYRSRRLSA